MTDSVRGFIVLRDFSAGIGLLSTLQKGQLMEALFADMEGTAMPELDPVANAVFQMMLPSVHAAQNAFSRRRETARENGAKGGRPRKDGGRPVPGQPHEQQAGQADALPDGLPDAERAGQPHGQPHGQPENRPVSGNRNRVDGKRMPPHPPQGDRAGMPLPARVPPGKTPFLTWPSSSFLTPIRRTGATRARPGRHGFPSRGQGSFRVCRGCWIPSRRGRLRSSGGRTTGNMSRWRPAS